MAGYPSGGPTSLTSADQFASEEYIKVRDSILAVTFWPFPLGGSRSASVTGTSYQDADDYLDFEVPDAASGGAVYKAIVDVLCENALTTITPKIRNITDSSDAVVGSAHASTGWGSQTLTFTPTVGKKYRLMFIKSDDLFRAYGIGFIRRTAA